MVLKASARLVATGQIFFVVRHTPKGWPHLFKNELCVGKASQLR